MASGCDLVIKYSQYKSQARFNETKQGTANCNGLIKGLIVIHANKAERAADRPKNLTSLDLEFKITLLSHQGN